MNKLTIAVATATVAAFGAPALAQTSALPASIEVVVPFAQGGGTDQVGRAFAEFARPHLDADTFVANRAGGSGAIGFRYGADGPQDGSVITMLVTTLTTAPHTIDGYPVSYSDFEPICLISAPPVALSVQAGAGIASLDDLVAEAEARGRTMTFGTAGPGSYTHLAGVAFTLAAGIEGRFVPHSGSQPALTATYGGHIDVALSEAAEALPWAEDGRLNVLAIFAGSRFGALPDVATAAEQGYDVDVGAFRGLGAPRGTPAPVMDALIEGCRATTEDPEFIAHMGNLGVEVDPLFGADFGQWLAGQHETFARAAAEAGLGQ